MVLSLLFIVPLIGGLLSWWLERYRVGVARWISLASLIASAFLVIALAVSNQMKFNPTEPGIFGLGIWWQEIHLSWIPFLGIGYHLALDGLSFLLVSLTVFLGFISLAASWGEIRDREGFYYLNLMWILAGITGVFLAMDLFLFYFFWELMLIPMFFLIAIWGHENRIYAAVKFFIFTQIPSLFMLLSILALAYAHRKATGSYSFDYNDLLGTPLSGVAGMWIMLGFFVAFAVKLPVVPVHTWLPDAHTEAPTAGSIILAGLLLKTGAYGFLRFILPLFPAASMDFAPVAMVLGMTGILYGAMLAFGQRDLKRLVAYTSVSHMGFVILGVFALQLKSMHGAVMQILCHGLSTGALFYIVGALQHRIHTRDLRAMGGLWSAVPRMGAWTLFFAIASLGMPGLGNFVSEFLVLLGAFRANPWIAAISTLGLVAAAVYSLWIVQKAFQGRLETERVVPDLNGRETTSFLAVAVLLVWLGLFPQPVLNTADSVLRFLHPATASEPRMIPMSGEFAMETDMPDGNMNQRSGAHK